MQTLILFDEYGNKIIATGTPKPGGEGDVYEVEGNPNLVVKIYNDKKRSKGKEFEQLIKKIKIMCDMCDQTIMSKAGWPQRIVYYDDEPVGFIMNKIQYSDEIHLLFDTVDRKQYFKDNEWKFLFYIAYNLACAFKVLHDKGIVIGDVNERNFLIGNRANAQEDGINDFKENGIVYSIDCDSFQIKNSRGYFYCTVATNEYLPPELLGKDLHKTVRVPNHDNFGLAVMIFKIIMLGRHPYSGTGTPGEIIESISNGCYIYAQDARKKGIYPPKPIKLYDTIYNSLNDEIKTLFEQAFSSKPNIKRPTSEDWINALKRQIDNLAQCNKNERHFYNKNGECIWCKIADEYKHNPWEIKPKQNYVQISYNSNNNSISSLDTYSINNNPPVQPQFSPDSNKNTGSIGSLMIDTITNIIAILAGFIVLLYELIKPLCSFEKINTIRGIIFIQALTTIVLFLPLLDNTITYSISILFLLNIINIIAWGARRKRIFSTIFLLFAVPIISAIINMCIDTPPILYSAYQVEQIFDENKKTSPNITKNKKILKEIIKEECIISDYLKGNASQENKDAAFLAFYNNIDRLSDSYYPITKYASLKKPLEENDSFNSKEVEYYTYVDHNRIWDISITDPLTDLFEFHINEHTLYFHPIVDAKYLKQKYGQYLSKSVNDFLQLQIIFNEDLNNRTYSNVINEWYEGEKYPFANKEILLSKWIKSYEDFLKKYPKFPLKDYINDSIYAFKNKTNIKKYNKNADLILK